MTQLLYSIFPGADYLRCLRSDPPILMNHDEDPIGASVFNALIGRHNLVLVHHLPRPAHPKAEVIVGFRRDDIAGECLRVAFSGIQTAYMTAMDQECALSEGQVRFFKNCLQERRFANDDAYVVQPQDLRRAAYLGVLKPELHATIRDASNIPHELVARTT